MNKYIPTLATDPGDAPTVLTGISLLSPNVGVAVSHPMAYLSKKGASDFYEYNYFTVKYFLSLYNFIFAIKYNLVCLI